MRNTQTRPKKKRPPSDTELWEKAARLMSLNDIISELFAVALLMDMPHVLRERIVWRLSAVSEEVNARAREVVP